MSCTVYLVSGLEMFILFLDDRFAFAYSLKQFPTLNNPTQLLSVKVKSVACGPCFTLFLTPSGIVFSKGIGT